MKDFTGVWVDDLRGKDGAVNAGDGRRPTRPMVAPSQGVHMYWMKFAIDVVLVDKEKRVVAVYPDLQPGKRTKMHWSAEYALELPAGALAGTGTDVGDQLEWTERGRVAA